MAGETADASELLLQSPDSMTRTNTISAAIAELPSFAERRRTADRIFRGALLVNIALTIFWLITVLTGGTRFFQHYQLDRFTIARLAGGIGIFYIVWGFIWYGVKNALLKWFVGFSKEERRQSFSSRMNVDFDVAGFVHRHSERRIRITDMVGRRGRFLMLGFAGFYYLYTHMSANPSPNFVTSVLADNLADGVITSWVFLGFYYANGFLAAAFYGPQSRVMDGVLARANCLLITTLWTVFKFVLVPIGAGLAVVFRPTEFPAVFALIWGSYIVCDGLSEVGGALFGKQKLRVWGIGDVNRKSIGGTVTGFVGCLVMCVWVVLAQGLPPASWIPLAVIISVSNTALELFSPRGTDDFVMATANALICWGYGALLL
jgi:hypothetical protein